MNPVSEREPSTVAGLTKGLAVLQELARTGEGTGLSLARALGLPRPTVHRLLDTLVAAGYVMQDKRGGPYLLTEKVTSLSDGFKDDDWLLGATRPMLEALRAQVGWPTDVAICTGGWMVIVASTHDQNPLSLDRVIRGRRVSVLTSALGRAYLAFCPKVECKALLASQQPATPLERDALKTPELFQRELEATRKRGYGLRIRGSQPKTASIAVPVIHDGWVVACINIHWIARAVSTDYAVQNYLGPLQQAAARLADEYRVYVKKNRPRR